MASCSCYLSHFRRIVLFVGMYFHENEIVVDSFCDSFSSHISPTDGPTAGQRFGFDAPTPPTEHREEPKRPDRLGE